MDWIRKPPAPLLRGQLFLETVENITILKTLNWCELAKIWAIKFRVSLSKKDVICLLNNSDWYLTAEEIYPYGNISIYPAKENGINETYPHQSYNLEGSQELLWRLGNICTNTQVHVIGRHKYDIERHTENERLAWHCQRAVEWVCCASTGSLTVSGEPFELPLTYPFCKNSEKVYFSEYGLDFLPPLGKRFLLGQVSLFNVKADKNSWFFETFTDKKKETTFSVSWGYHIGKIKDQSWKGAWLALRAMPVVKPYRFPETWGELEKVLLDQQISIKSILKWISRNLRDKKPHFFLIGFPISSTYDGPLYTIHWLAIKLPALSSAKNYLNGFRANEQGYFENDIRTTFHRKNRIQYMPIENWHPSQIQNRGRFKEDFRDCYIGVIGCGSLGAPIAEMFVRGGVSHLVVIDHDIIEIGNLARHTLSLNDVGKEKATQLAQRLNSLTPHAKVDSAVSELSYENKEILDKIQKCNIIIDCTGSDEVLFFLKSLSSAQPINFYSISIGFSAKRMFFFYAKQTSFPNDSYKLEITPWLKLERAEFTGESFPRDRIGCYHPVFPARCDDIWLWASIAVKSIEKFYNSQNPENIFHVYEQKEAEGGSVSIQRLVEASHG